MRLALVCVAISAAVAALTFTEWSAATAERARDRAEHQLEQRTRRAHAFQARMRPLAGLPDRTTTNAGVRVVCRTRGSHADGSPLAVTGRVRAGDVFVQVCRGYAAGGPAG